jgi:putative Holliday junction resolvase
VRHIGLDIGTVRIGVSVSDPDGRVATPLTVLDARKTINDRSRLTRLIVDLEAGLIVVGLPVSLDGTEGPQADGVRRTAERLAEHLPCPIVFFDERLSTVEAHRVMSASGVRAREARGDVDKVAATLMLQGYLDSSRAGEDGGR